MQNLVDILKLAENEAEPMGLLVVDTKICQEGKNRILAVSIYRKGGRISLSDCEELSRKLDRAMSEHVPPLIEGGYMLEIQSPGIDRLLQTDREFSMFAGQKVEVLTREKVTALGDNFTGKLHSLADGVLTIDNPEPKKTNSKTRKKAKSDNTKPELPGSICLDMSKIAHVRLHPSEPAPGQPEE